MVQHIVSVSKVRDSRHFVTDLAREETGKARGPLNNISKKDYQVITNSDLYPFVGAIGGWFLPRHVPARQHLLLIHLVVVHHVAQWTLPMRIHR